MRNEALGVRLDGHVDVSVVHVRRERVRIKLVVSSVNLIVPHVRVARNSVAEGHVLEAVGIHHAGGGNEEDTSRAVGLSGRIEAERHLSNESRSPVRVAVIPRIVVVVGAPGVTDHVHLVHSASRVRHVEHSDETVGVAHSNTADVSVLVVTRTGSADTGNVAEVVVGLR